MELSFTKVNYHYQTEKFYQALTDINLSFNPRDITVILGPAGAGKSTLLEHCNALLIPSSGEINILGRIVSQKKQRQLKDLRRQIGLVFQFPEYQLFAQSVLDDIAFGPKNFKTTRKQAKELAIRAANTLGIDDSLFKKHPLKLSGGQMRLVAMAGILAMNPKYLVLDEPTRGLDHLTTKHITNLIKKMHDSQKGIIIVTHDVDFALEVGTRFIVLNQGKIIFDGNQKEFLNITDYSLLGLNTPINMQISQVLNDKLGTNLQRHAEFDTLINEIKEQLL